MPRNALSQHLRLRYLHKPHVFSQSSLKVARSHPPGAAVPPKASANSFIPSLSFFAS